MEEQPRDRAPERQYHHRGVEDRAAGQNHAQSRSQQQEAQAKKTGNRKLNISDEEEEKNSYTSNTVGMSHPSSSNGNRHIINTNAKQKSTQKLYTPVPKVTSKTLDHKKSMDLKTDKDKALDLRHHESQHVDKKDSGLIPNGLVNCGFITNGYSNKPAPDNDGSGSEGGYTTPKKHKARCNSIKSGENVTREKDRDIQQGSVAHESGTFGIDAAEKGINSRLEGLRTVQKGDAQSAGRRAVASEAALGESQRKNSDGKPLGTFSKKFEERHKSKLSSPSKEDSWTLFKPPPVFPVDNSSAKIVPKISYASKVKENLNKVAQTGAEAPPPPVRLSQVPMSAMKTITSASFTNGPVSGNGNVTFFAPAASSIAPASSLPNSEHVASHLDSHCSSTTSPVDAEAFELRKCTLLIYPLNMQPVLPSARQVDPLSAQTNQKALGEIFQNQWGLSFINEPNLEPGAGSGQTTAEDKTTVVTLQGERPAARPCFDASPLILEPATSARDPEKRTGAPCNVSTCPSSPATEEGEKTKVEAKSPAPAVPAPGIDAGSKAAQGLLTTLSFGLSKDQSQARDPDRRCSSWGLFDIKAAVTYHTKEIEYIFNLQKQDPKKVVTYDKTRDGPEQ